MRYEHHEHRERIDHEQATPHPMKTKPHTGNRAALQRAAAELDAGAPSSVTIPQSGGAPLPPGIRTQMERSMQADFSGVRVHQGNTATKLGALAFTQGNDLHFGPGQYNPSSSSGRAMIGHELAHVVQQREGRVHATGSVSGVALNDDPRLESEADKLAARAMTT